MTNDLEKTVATLTATKEWLLTHDWTRGSYFRDKHGLAVKSYDKACSACTVGAVAATCGISNSFTWNDCTNNPIRALASQIQLENAGGSPTSVPDGTVITWNDQVGRTKDDVLALLDRTIERLNAQRVDVV